jgi:hypothetical protein
MPDNKPESYSDARLDEISREVFFKAMTEIKTDIGTKAAMDSDRLRALAAVADAASCGFDDKGDEGDE